MHWLSLFSASIHITLFLFFLYKGSFSSGLSPAVSLICGPTILHSAFPLIASLLPPVSPLPYLISHHISFYIPVPFGQHPSLALHSLFHLCLSPSLTPSVALPSSLEFLFPIVSYSHSPHPSYLPLSILWSSNSSPLTFLPLFTLLFFLHLVPSLLSLSFLLLLFYDKWDRRTTFLRQRKQTTPLAAEKSRSLLPEIQRKQTRYFLFYYKDDTLQPFLSLFNDIFTWDILVNCASRKVADQWQMKWQVQQQPGTTFTS